MNNETVTITTKEYLELLDAQKTLEFLLGAGVDNWEGYDTAMEMMRDEKPE